MHLINRVPSAYLGKKSHYELFYDKLLELHDISVFGYLCFACTIERNKSKPDPRARKCVFLRYKSDTKSYIVLNINSSEILIIRNINFMKMFFHM